MKLHIHLLFISALVVLSFCGCSSGTNPALPDDTSSISQLDLSNDPLTVGVSDRFPDGTPASGAGVLGLYSLHLDTSSISAELIPLRETTLTDVLEKVDITNFLSMAPCTDCAKLNSVSLDTDGNLVLSIGIKHPFGAGDPLKPITGRNRGDLHIFNVEGIIVSNAVGVSFPSLGKTLANFNLVSADGYTEYLDSVLEDIFPTDATIHPFVLHFDDYTAGNFDPGNPMGFENVTDPGPSGNLIMPMGSDYDNQDYVFNIPGEMDFIYAAGCTYAVSSASKSERFTPEYRIPQHNKKAASEVRVNILSNDLADGDNTSTAVLEIEVLDISHGVSVGTTLDEMLADSSVASISVEIPSVTSSPVVVTSPVPTGGDGRDPLNPLTYEMTITNNALGVEGTYSGLVKVLDSYQPGQNTSPLLNGMDGIKRVDPLLNPLEGLFDISEFATYAVFSIDVATGFTSEPPVAIISSPCPTNEIHDSSSLFFDGRLSADDFPPLAGYAWDFDWDSDPLNFDVDSALDHLNHQFITTGNFTIGLRVEDSEGQFGYASVSVTVISAFQRSWQTSILVSGMSGIEDCLDSPSHQIVVDCDGIVHIVFSFGSSGGPPSGMYYVNYDGATMSSPEYFAGTSYSVRQPTIKIDNQGILHFTYILSNSVYYCTRTGGTWSAPEVIISSADTPGFNILNPSMSINYRGEIMVIFTKQDPSTANYTWYIGYIFNDGTGWSAHQDITEVYLKVSGSSYTRPNEDVLVDNDGKFHLLYKSWPDAGSPRDYDLWHVIYDGGSWGTTNKFCDDSGTNISLIGYVAPDGDVFAAWQTSMFGTFNVMYQRYDAQTQTWGSSTRVSQNPLSGDYSFIPDVAVDTEGNVMYVWEYYDDTGLRHIYYKTFHETDSAATILNATENDLVTGAWHRTEPNTYFESNGRIHLIWEDERSDPGNYSQRDIYYSVWE